MHQQWRTSPNGSGGIAVRRGAAVALLRDAHPDQQPVLDAVLDALDAAAADPSPGRRLARQVAALVASSESDAVPDLCLLGATDDDGIAALLVGDTELVVESAAGVGERLSGRDVATWVDRILRPPLHRLQVVLGSASGDVPASGRVDLRDGVVPAGALVLTLSAAAPVGGAAQALPAVHLPPEHLPAAPAPAAPVPAAPAPVVAEPNAAPEPDTAAIGPAPVPEVPRPRAVQPAPAPAGTGGRARQTFSVIPLLGDVPGADGAPLPVEVTAPESDLVTDGPVVQGIRCGRQHFNDPSSRFCAACGLSLVHQTHHLVAGPRPPLGVLLGSDGGVITLSSDYVVGREPQASDLVRSGAATPLEIEDDSFHVSRVHAAIRLHDWDVRVVDLGSANGTFVSRPGLQEWERLEPDEPRTVLPGGRIRIGERIFSFDSHRRQA